MPFGFFAGATSGARETLAFTGLTQMQLTINAGLSSAIPGPVRTATRKWVSPPSHSNGVRQDLGPSELVEELQPLSLLLLFPLLCSLALLLCGLGLLAVLFRLLRLVLPDEAPERAGGYLEAELGR